MKCLPVGMSVYARAGHVRQTVEALSKNLLAEKTRFFVFSDAPKPGDEEKVSEVRKYLRTIRGFKSVEIVERTENDRVKNNRGGMQTLLDQFGAMIFMEEDVLTAPGFLTFMNQAMEKYDDRDDILSVSGHSPNLRANARADVDAFLSRRFHPWGFGITRANFELITALPSWPEISKDKDTLMRLNEMGKDMLPMIKAEADGAVNALDLRICYASAKLQKWHVLPTQTLVRNIGIDGTGAHCDTHNPYLEDSLSVKTVFRLDEHITPNKRALREHKKFYSPSLSFPQQIKRLAYKMRSKVADP